MNRFITVSSAVCLLLCTQTHSGWGGEYRPPLPFDVMYDRLKVGMDRVQAHEITRATELEREPADLHVTELLRLETVNRGCRAELLRLHWYKGRMHRIEHFQLDAAGIAYRERGDPDPVGEGLARRLTDLLSAYASGWHGLSALIEEDGPPALRAKAGLAAEKLQQRLDDLRRTHQK
jgi:hypothetical protein